MAELTGQVVAVSQQEENCVLVSFPMAGFPPRFELRPGDRVVLMNEEGGLVARPFVRVVPADAPPGEVTATGEGRNYTISEAAVREEGSRLVLFVVDNEADLPGQVLAIRNRR